MIYPKIGRYVKKAITLGPKKTAQLILQKAQQSVYQKYQRSRAMARKVSWDWDTIATHNKYDEPFEFYFERVRVQLELPEQEIIPAHVKNETIIEHAQNFAHNCFDLLGSGKQCFIKIPWHQDFRCAQTTPKSSHNFALEYYKDIKIVQGDTQELEKDIKVPWELSRFQHLIILGKAYELTSDEKYVHAFQAQVDDWLENNPLLLGPNWACAMDVAIRALNWIWAFHYFKYAPSITIEFWQRFFCSLYDHFDYLEHHWEIYDSRTSNHYFSDLIGYYYLCYFFKSLSRDVLAKASWCHDALKAEMEKQIFDEGTDYEGSTSYHKLITEIVHHYMMISKLFDFNISESEKEKFQRMLEFVDWCQISKNEMIKIGDDDSGKIIYFGLNHHATHSLRGRKDFAQFGLSIYKNDRLHVSLRHHSYRSFQPSGHHHSDVGSVTLAVDGIPVFIDPGSFVYTPSAYWRNKFRSIKMHNTVYLDDQEPIMFDDRLFALELPEKNNIPCNENENILRSSHELYPNISINRSIEVLNDSIAITDFCIPNADPLYKTMHWNFILHPEIEVHQKDKKIILVHNKNNLLQLESDLMFAVSESFYSPAYGIKLPCKHLKLTAPFDDQKRTLSISF